MNDPTIKAYTATDLDYFTGTATADDAANLASHLIAITDLSKITPSRAARTIAETTARDFPAAGANDTASREAIWAILSAKETMSDRLIRSDRTREALKKARA